MNKKLKELQEKAIKANNEYREAEEECRKNEMIPKLRARIGQCFVYRNSYGGDSEKWNLYTKILGLDENANYICEQFQETSMSLIEIRLKEIKLNYTRDYFDDSSYFQITPMEYEDARKSLIEKLL